MTTIDKQLTPSESADIAGAVYRLKNSSEIERNFRDSLSKGIFDFSGNAMRFEAKSGAFGFKTKYGFGVMAMGQKDTDYEGHALLACRGTVGAKDTLTDLNAGIQMTRSGHKVHAGFMRTFRDFEQHTHRFISANNPTVVHCVGHSLGGALANLSANSIINRKSGPHVALYTYGAPRVGDAAFASHLSLSNKIGIDNIHRVYHGGDPVAMLPLWPFVHAPQPGGECYIGTMLSFNPMQHLMKNYIESVKDKTWATLTSAHPAIGTHVEQWISSPLAYAGLNAYNIMMLGKALQLALKKVLTAGWTCAGLTLVAGASFLDHLAYLLDGAAKTSDENSTLISHVLQRALRMCGVKVSKNMSITKQFIRYVLTTLTLAMGRFVEMALNASRSVGF